VLVHCAQGVRRTGFFVAAYQMSVMGYDQQKAKDSILTFGHSDNTINDIRKFIDGYDAKEQAVGSR
jgi:protein tyrosine/serine phosphatase